ncbi:MAG: nuclear transport factor 2 family protein [Dehalococcoidia bacterium]
MRDVKVEAKERRNLQVVQTFISAIGSGDTPTAVDKLADDVYWESPVSLSPPPELVWAKPRHGRQQVLQFIQDMWSVVQPYVMDTLGVVAQGDRVIIEGRHQCQVRSTGKFYDHQWVQVFVLKDGLITSQQQYYDTAPIVEAFRDGN